MNINKIYVNDQGDTVCEHGTALDCHCCNCHSGFLFNIEDCVCDIGLCSTGLMISKLKNLKLIKGNKNAN